MKRTISVKSEYHPVVAKCAHLYAAVDARCFVPRNKKSFTGGIGLSGEILDLLLVRLRS
ncbi:MAG: hypothetical protein ACP5VS_15625 [Desulfomonilaceae bacterium]